MSSRSPLKVLQDDRGGVPLAWGPKWDAETGTRHASFPCAGKSRCCTRLRHDDYTVQTGRVLVTVAVAESHPPLAHRHQAAVQMQGTRACHQFLLDNAQGVAGNCHGQRRHEPTCCLEHSRKPMLLFVGRRQPKAPMLRCCKPRPSSIFSMSLQDVHSTYGHGPLRFICVHGAVKHCEPPSAGSFKLRDTSAHPRCLQPTRPETPSSHYLQSCQLMSIHRRPHDTLIKR
jgi:hypothetical protein